jgi:hypothetical protein
MPENNVEDIRELYPWSRGWSSYNGHNLNLNDEL